MVSKAQLLVDILEEKHGTEPTTLSREYIKEVAKENEINSLYRVINTNNVARDGFYHFPPIGKSSGGKVSNTPRKRKKDLPAQEIQHAPNLQPNVSSDDADKVKTSSLTIEHDGFTDSLIPKKDQLFTKFGQFATIKKVLHSGLFFPIYITGLSGNGKTHMVNQACAELERELIRVNFTVETDEDDLIGGFRLINGETKFFKGPVITAMERGAVLLLDEIDLGNPAKVMCLQSILEGSGYFIKKTGEFIEPAAGFTIVATANTKGKGSDDGRFIGTNIMNEAFLERFPVTLEQEYPSVVAEGKLLSKVFTSLEVDDAEFVECLCKWAEVIRKTFEDDGIDEVISTRRLVHIAKSYAIFGSRVKAIKACISRFDEETKSAFLDLYKKIDATIELEDSNENFNEETDPSF